MDAAIGVLIIDESEALDPSLRAAIEHEPSLCTLDEADLDDLQEDIVVALVVLPDAGLTATADRIAALKQKWARLKVVVAIQSLAGDALRILLASGADAIVARQASLGEVCAAVHGLTQGGNATSADRPQLRDLGEGLTPREAEILRFLSAGFSNKEVARRLSLSVRTVETHRLNLRRKTQTGRLKDLVALARNLGLTPIVEAETPRRSSCDLSGVTHYPALDAAHF